MKLKIFTENPYKYKNHILKFWSEYLPQTSSSRYDWLVNSNPAGETIWFFASDLEKDKVIGTVSIIPREIMVDGKLLRAGIVGDFMVDSNYRVLGPALRLQKAVISNYSKFGFDFLYSIPNPSSEKILKRVGYKEVGKWYKLVKPINLKYYIEKYLSKKLSNFFRPLLILSNKFYLSQKKNVKGYLEEGIISKERLNNIWKLSIEKNSCLRGVHSYVFLEWRFFQNKSQKYQIISFRKNKNSDILAYAITKKKNFSLYIEYINFVSSLDMFHFLYNLSIYAKERGLNGICITVFQNHNIVKLLKKMGFIITDKSNFELLSFDPGNKIVNYDWCLFESDII
ncbi:MAG: GNAT family N-acetyltransferase [Promethearchaeota archaeon]